MIARRTVWSDARVQELAKEFVAAADEVHYLQTVKGPEGELFRKIAEQGHYAGRTKPTNTRQGLYCAAPSGVLLASINSNDPKRVAAMMEKALDKWKTLSREERLRVSDGKEDRPRWEAQYPKDGLVLRVNSRDLQREKTAKDWRASAWNQDFAWFRKDEARGFVPAELKPESSRSVRAALIRRLARCHFVDNVRGQTSPFSDEEIEKAELTSTVSKVEGDVVWLRFEGTTRASASGTWPVRGYEDMDKPGPQKRGYESKLLGFARFDRKKEMFVAFELVAVGSRWGGTQYNGRGDDLDPAPMGFVLTLAGESPSDRVAPAAIWSYGWK